MSSGVSTEGDKSVIKMRNFTPALLTVFTLLTKVKSSGVFEVLLTSLSNDKGMTSRGECCYSKDDRLLCAEQCRTFVTICLMHYQNKVVRSYPTCTFGQFATPLLGGNNIDLREETGDGPYTVRLPFTFSWPNSFTLIIEVWHDEFGNRSIAEEKLILQVIKTATAKPSLLWTTAQKGNMHAELTYAYRVVCDQNYYGDGCDRFCRARDDNFGHYTCSGNGTKLCLKGWSGSFCEQAVCHERCKVPRGSCDNPVTCRCRLGWRGEYCENCIKSPDCHHGYCHEPWQCICEEGWVGINCNIDSHFCQRYQPCRNGGTCKSDWNRNYTCACPQGYSGMDCELPTCQPGFCQNGGSCLTTVNSVDCQCKDGFYGDRCEKVRLTCDDVVCHNNGTCTLDGSEPRCDCPAGFIGPACDLDVHECMSSPCQNGGTCVDEPGQFRCVCPAGFVGSLCQISTDACRRLSCKNGGKCSIMKGMSQCHCPFGFEGETCEIVSAPCSRSICANGGSCIPGNGGSHCSCRKGYRGRTCRIATKSCNCKTDSLCNDPGMGKNCNCTNSIQSDCQELLLSNHQDVGLEYPPVAPVISKGEMSKPWSSVCGTLVLLLIINFFV